MFGSVKKRLGEIQDLDAQFFKGLAPTSDLFGMHTGVTTLPH